MPGEPQPEPPRRSDSHSLGPSSERKSSGRQSAVDLLQELVAELESRIATQRSAWARNQDDELALLARQVRDALGGVHAPRLTAIASQLDAMTLADDAAIIELFEKLESLTRLCREASIDRTEFEPEG